MIQIISERAFLYSHALSFYRSQNVLGWSKILVPHQKFIYILWQSQIFCARQKDEWHLVKLVFEEALNAVKFFGLAQNIWTSTKHYGTCKRSMRYFFVHQIKHPKVNLKFLIFFPQNIPFCFDTHHCANVFFSVFRRSMKLQRFVAFRFAPFFISCLVNTKQTL